MASSVPQLHCFGMQPPRARQVARLWDHALVAALRAVVRVGGICIKDNPRPGSTAVLRTIKKNHERLRDRKESKRVRRRMNVLLLLAACPTLIAGSPTVCANSEGDSCACQGKVYFGKKFKDQSCAWQSVCATTTFAELKAHGHAIKDVSGTIACSIAGMGGGVDT